MPPKSQVPIKRCPVDGCKVRLEGANANTKCAKCGLHVCSEHIFPIDHVCQTKTLPPQPKIEVGIPTIQFLKAPSTSTENSAKKKEEENNTAPPINSLADDTIESLSTEFLQVANKKRFNHRIEAGKLLRALDAYASNSKLESDILEQAHSAFGRISTSSQSKDALASLESYLFESDSSSFGGAWIGYGMLISRIHNSDQSLFDAIDHMIVSFLKFKEAKSWMGRAISESLCFRKLDSDPSLLENSRCLDIISKLRVKLDTSTGAARAMNVAYSLAGIAEGIGAPQSVFELQILTTDSPNLYLLKALADVCERRLEPLVWKWTKSIGEFLLSKYSKGDPEIRNRAYLAAKAICEHSLGPTGTVEWVENLIKATKDVASWRAKEYGFDLLDVIIKSHPDYLHEQLPNIV